MEINLDNGKKINVPFEAKQIKFGSYSDFKKSEQDFLVSCQSFPEGINPEDLTPEQFEEHVIYKTDPEESISHIIEAVSIICGDVSYLEFRDDTEREDEVLNPKELLSTNITTQRLYYHIVNVINAYQPKKISKDYVIKLNGVDYVLHWDKDMASKSLSNGEVLTILEANKQADKLKDDKGIVDGSIGYNLGLEMTAILIRKEGEELPSNRRERIAFINQRKKLFEFLPMNIVLDIIFFLRSTTTKSLTTQLTGIFSSAKEIKRQERKKKRRHKSKRKMSGR